MSSTTVLNGRAHGVERAAERRATRLGRMVNDMITWEGVGEREGERYCVEESSECAWMQLCRRVILQ